jgi:hypothetical protein
MGQVPDAPYNILQKELEGVLLYATVGSIRKIRLIEGNAKCRHRKELTWGDMGFWA